MKTTVRNRYTGAEELYTLPPEQALVSAAILEDGGIGILDDEGKRRYYAALIIRNAGKTRLGNWEVINEVK